MDGSVIYLTDTREPKPQIYTIDGKPIRTESSHPDYKFRKHKNVPLHIISSLLIIILTLLLATVSFLYFVRNYPICETEECLQIAASIKSSMNLSADPCDDFYNYVCGNWPKSHPPMCPSEFGEHWNDWFMERENLVTRKVKGLIKNIPKKANQPWAVEQAHSLYQSCMDTKSWDAQGLQPIYSLLDDMKVPRVPAGLTNKTSNFWMQYANIHRVMAVDIYFHTYVYEDMKDRRKRMIVLDTPMSSKPFSRNRFKKGNYLMDITRVRTEPEDLIHMAKSWNQSRFDKLARSFVSSVVKYIVTNGTDETLLGTNTTINETMLEYTVATIFRVHKHLVKTHIGIQCPHWEVIMKNPDKHYMKLSKLQNITDAYLTSKNKSLATKAKWKSFMEEYFREVEGFNPEQKVFVGCLDWLKNISYFLTLIDDKDLEIYQWWMSVRYAIPFGPSELRKKLDDFVEMMDPHDERNCQKNMQCVEEVDETMEMVVARLYVESSKINLQEKAKVQRMLEYIKTSFKVYVKHLHWMDRFTKNATLKKVDKMTSLINYPDWIMDDKQLNQYYEGFNMSKDAHFDNLVRISKLLISNDLHEIVTPKNDEEQWLISPTTLNAIHVYERVQITIPRVILEFPYHELGLEYLNYGALGAIVGHEFIHGFDNSGRQFDSNGELKSWWSSGTVTNYTKRAECFVKQYDRFYMPEVNENVRGERTLDENIADNGGLRQSFRAYQIHKKVHGRERSLPGFEQLTNDQLFFVAFSHMWCASYTPHGLQTMMRDVHAPAPARVIGTLQNTKQFSDAWKCPVGSKMNPSEKCRLW